MKRHSFIKISALALLAPLANNFALQAATNKNIFFDKDDILKKLVAANDKQVAILLQSISEGNIVFSRKIGQDFANLAAAYVTTESQFYHSSLIVPKLEILISSFLFMYYTNTMW